MSIYTTVVEVPTETGSTCVIDVVRDDMRDTYQVTFSGELLDQAPEALTAAVQLALLNIQSWRVLDVGHVHVRCMPRPSQAGDLGKPTDS